MTNQNHELILSRLIDAPRKNVYRCWTEAELLKQWFAPKPFTTPVVEFDLRPGGRSLFIMESPEGQKMPNPGQFLEIVPNEKLVFTDAFVGDWRPREGKPFMTAIITFADEGGKTRYTARVLHWTAEDKAQHEQM
ncbi:MAG: SRPBCC family protein, partial [Alphaproteobacteria bacterium]|nr:SRPBCC family protein [Alphaproteobacteria bacterium]